MGNILKFRRFPYVDSLKSVLFLECYPHTIAYIARRYVSRKINREIAFACCLLQLFTTNVDDNVVCYQPQQMSHIVVKNIA